ncbi:MAG: hypothetical protein Q4A64_03290 [Porphyromonadaceae bacterium]|nr:hypothetical protein [Porphyromonadaceae bacterium]
MSRLITIPLSRSQWEGIETNKAVALPESEYWTKRLYNEDGAKLYERVNIRLGVSGAPRQFVFAGVSYSLNADGEAVYRIRLGREIPKVSKETFLDGLHLALNELIWEACEACVAHATSLKIDSLKYASRKYRDLHREYRHIMLYSHTDEYREQVEHNKRDLRAYWSGTIEGILQASKRSIVQTDGEIDALMMHCEAIVGILYARLSERIHEYNGKPKEHRAVVEVNKHLAEMLDVYAGTYGINPTWEAQALALMGREIKNYYQLHKWI